MEALRKAACPLRRIRASSPRGGATGEKMKLSVMPKPPLVRSNNDDRRQWRKQGVAVGAAASRMRAAAKQTLGAATRAVARRRRDGEGACKLSVQSLTFAGNGIYYK